MKSALAAYQDLAHVPADVVEFERDDLAGAQAKSERQGEVATGSGRITQVG